MNDDVRIIGNKFLRIDDDRYINIDKITEICRYGTNHVHIIYEENNTHYQCIINMRLGLFIELLDNKYNNPIKKKKW